MVGEGLVCLQLLQSTPLCTAPLCRCKQLDKADPPRALTPSHFLLKILPLNMRKNRMGICALGQEDWGGMLGRGYKEPLWRVRTEHLEDGFISFPQRSRKDLMEREEWLLPHDFTKLQVKDTLSFNVGLQGGPSPSSHYGDSDYCFHSSPAFQPAYSNGPPFSRVEGVQEAHQAALHFL